MEAELEVVRSGTGNARRINISDTEQYRIALGTDECCAHAPGQPCRVAPPRGLTEVGVSLGLWGVMAYIIAEPCIDLKDRSCVDVCPVDCIYEGEKQLFIHPDECIDCGACEPECPVTAIFPEEDTPPQWKHFIALNRDVFQSENPPGKPQRKGA